MKRVLSVLLVLTLLLAATVSVSAAETAPCAVNQNAAAQALYSLGLFLGTGSSHGIPEWHLEGTLTRAQGIVLLVRMIGKEAEAKATPVSHPFTDTVSWYDAHVSYAYANGLTKGTGSKTYSGSSATNEKMFATFCLRALGYTDKKTVDDASGDFWWADAPAFARSLGISVSSENPYTRGDAVMTFWDVLNTKQKGSTKTLAEKLIADGIFTEQQFETAKNYAAGQGVLYTAPTDINELPEVEITGSSQPSQSGQTTPQQTGTTPALQGSNELPEIEIG